MHITKIFQYTNYEISYNNNIMTKYCSTIKVLLKFTNIILFNSADGVISIQERSTINGLLKFANLAVFYSADGVICIKKASCNIESKTVI